MDELVIRIYEEAKPLLPCDFFTGRESFEDLMHKVLTAKGAEFCISHDFPGYDLCAEIKARGAADRGIYIDAGEMALTNPKRVAIVGNTEATLSYDTAGYPCRVILMKGAKAHIKASGYAVVAVQAQDGCQYDVETKDNAVVR